MKNPNDMAAEYYDKLYYSYITGKVTKNELKTIKKHIKKGHILDVACGTGRHMIPLLKSGYEVTGVDISSGMLKVLKTKLRQNNLNGKLLNQNIKTFRSKKHFDGVILFWNAFNEIAISEKDAEKVARTFYKLLNEKGSIMLDFCTSPYEGVYTQSTKDGKNFYKISYKGNYDKKSRISKDIEILEVFKNGKLIKRGKAVYKHRLWTKDELNMIFKCAGFSSVKFYNKGNQMTLMIAKK